MNVAFLSLTDHLYISNKNISPTGDPLQETAFAFERSMRGFVMSTNCTLLGVLKIESEYDQEIPQSQTADNPIAMRGRAAHPSQDTRKTN